jgi:hypothetical protein
VVTPFAKGDVATFQLTRGKQSQHTERGFGRGVEFCGCAQKEASGSLLQGLSRVHWSSSLAKRIGKKWALTGAVEVALSPGISWGLEKTGTVRRAPEPFEVFGELTVCEVLTGEDPGPAAALRRRCGPGNRNWRGRHSDSVVKG